MESIPTANPNHQCFYLGSRELRPLTLPHSAFFKVLNSDFSRFDLSFAPLFIRREWSPSFAWQSSSIVSCPLPPCYYFCTVFGHFHFDVQYLCMGLKKSLRQEVSAAVLLVNIPHQIPKHLSLFLNNCSADEFFSIESHLETVINTIRSSPEIMTTSQKGFNS